MITKVTDWSKYEDLFARAWEELRQRGEFTDSQVIEDYAAEGNKFNSLEDYFTKIATFINVPAGATYPTWIKYWDKEEQQVKTQVNPIYKSEQDAIDNPRQIKPAYEFIMLPLDEARFEINANTRDIIIPSEFRRLVGVEGDHIAETLIFSIDRFVDYIDLLPSATNHMQIYIQWKDELEQDRATAVSIIHYDEKTQKILFGWPLSSEVTKKARNINFSVRFFVKIEGSDTITYSFNTKTHSITIAPALQANLNANIEMDSAADSYINAIKNSPSTKAPPAADPLFMAPGKNLLPEKDVLDTDDELIVEAVIPGSGHINYLRWTKNGNSINDSNNVSEEYRKIVPQPTEKMATKVYYTSTESGDVVSANSCTQYTSSFPEDLDDLPVLYERVYVYKLPASNTDVVGEYRAWAQNQTSNNISGEIGSTTCEIKGPPTIKFTTSGDLETNVIPSEGATSIELTVVAEPDEENEIVNSYVYKWSYKAPDAETFSEIPEVTTATYTINVDDLSTESGFYQVEITPKRNRKVDSSKTITSQICRISVAPQSPILNEETPLLKTTDSDDKNTPYVIFTANASTTVNGNSSLGDRLVYTWYGQRTDIDGEYVEITADTADDYGASATLNAAYDTNILNVYSGDEDEEIYYMYSVKSKINEHYSESVYLNADDAIAIS